MMISQAVLMIAFSGILNMTGMDYFSSKQAVKDSQTEAEKNIKRLVDKRYFHSRVEYNMPVIEPSPASQYHILSIKPDPTKDYTIHVIDPDTRMGKIGKFSKGK